MNLRFIAATGVFALCLFVNAQTKIKWQGYSWNVKSVASEGPGPNRWDASNVWVDSKGFLHLKIDKVNGQWSCAEIWTDKPLGFGTYQCVTQGPIDKLDANVIFSMFSYAGPDGVKEIDIEYAKWGNPEEKNGWWTVYPQDTTVKQVSYGFNLTLSGDTATSRYVWSKEGVHYSMLDGDQNPKSTENTKELWDFRPANSDHAVPQSPLPLHFNLWLFQGKPPTDGKPVEIVVKQFVRVRR